MYVFGVALATDLVAITIIAYGLYYRRHRRRDLLLAFYALNIGVVAVTVALGSMEAGIGLGLGLFGVLSIIRLRSDQITQQEIAYYFISLALGLLAGLHPEPIWLTPVLAVFVVVVMYVLDHPKVANKYHRVDLILDKAFLDQKALTEHLEGLGYEDPRAEISQVDLVRDMTQVDLRYRGPRQTSTKQDNELHQETVAEPWDTWTPHEKIERHL